MIFHLSALSSIIVVAVVARLSASGSLRFRCGAAD